MIEAQRLAERLEAKDCAYHPAPLYVQAAAELRRLDAECDALRLRAARYDWLRNGSNWPAVFATAEDPEPLRGAELDAAMAPPNA